MRLFGGQIEAEEDFLFEYLTDSGRSSLRLLLNGLSFKNFLIPDFLCSIVIDVFEQLEIKYSFYTVEKDLSIDFSKINMEDYDVIYLINYFGKTNAEYFQYIAGDQIVVEDMVFQPSVTKPPALKNWIGFNSFRKISAIADGSLIRSTIPLDLTLISSDESPAVELCYKGKYAKYNFIKGSTFLSERDYLQYFEEAERKLDNQRQIYSMSHKSLFKLFDYLVNYTVEEDIREKNYLELLDQLSEYSINNEAKRKQLFVMSVENRDDLKKYLAEKGIYLPIHWPNTYDIKNPLYDRVISIPVDSRYSTQDMKRIAKVLKDFYK